jgi:hypothetical protein
MPPPRQIESFHHREFYVIVGESGKHVLAVAYNQEKAKVASVTGETPDVVKREIKDQLNQMSQEFIGFPGAINLFLRAFPDGFRSEFHDHYERGYKDTAAEFVCKELGRERIDRLLAGNGFERVCTLAMEAVRKTNLCASWEQIKLADALKVENLRQPFAEHLTELLYGDFDRALQDLNRLLKPDEAAKWPILTYWPFLRFPDRHMFLKPKMTENCATRLGYELDYDSSPNPRTYRSLLDFTDFLRNGIAELEPRDNIDLQTFMYVVSRKGYVNKAIEYRRMREKTS